MPVVRTNEYAACHTMWELLHKKDQLSTAWVTKRLQLAACFREGSISGYCGTGREFFITITNRTTQFEIGSQYKDIQKQLKCYNIS